MIHQAQIKKAEKIGVVLAEVNRDTGEVDAHWVQHNVHARGIGAKAALDEIEAVQKIKAMSDDYRVVNKPDDDGMILLYNSDRSLVLDRDGATPRDTLLLLSQAIENGTPWKTTKVPDDGGQAHKEGWHITDNPFEEGDDNYEKWDAAWEASAEAAVGEEEDDTTGGSVVKQEYRIRYAEAGHPNHCGDWLANMLNQLVLGKSSTDIEKFDAICAANGVDLSKYNRTTPGWQGRLRMTGRNLLARKIYLANGVLVVPEIARTDANVGELRAPADWMAAQRYKMPKAELQQAEAQKRQEQAA